MTGAMMSFLTAHPFLTMSAYILMLAAGFTFMVEWGDRRRLKKQVDEHSEFIGHESYRGEEE